MGSTQERQHEESPAVTSLPRVFAVLASDGRENEAAELRLRDKLGMADEDMLIILPTFGEPEIGEEPTYSMLYERAWNNDPPLIEGADRPEMTQESNPSPLYITEPL